MSALPAQRKHAQQERPAEPPQDADDLALAAALRENPTATAERIHARFAKDVNRLVWRLLGADAEHHDLVQQVFLKIIVNGRRLRDPERLSSWVQAITVNTVYEELRKRDLRRLLHRDTPTNLHPNLVRDVELRDLLLRAKAMMDKLPAKERIVFVLHHVEGRTLADVADLCGFSLATAKRRLGAAHRRFERLAAGAPDLLSLFSRERDAP